jgi:hypothetical protein
VTGGSEATVKVSFAAKDERNLSSKYLEKHVDAVTSIATHVNTIVSIFFPDIKP